jgi:hypothetical protein
VQLMNGILLLQVIVVVIVLAALRHTGRIPFLIPAPGVLAQCIRRTFCNQL